MWKKCALFFLALSLHFALPSWAAEPDPLSLRQTMLSSALREALASSRQSMTDLEAYYNSMIRGLEIQLETQSQELIMLSHYLTNTIYSFRALSQELENSTRLYLLERQRRQKNERILFTIGSVAFAFIVAKIIVFALTLRGIRVPKWVKILV